MILSVNKLSYDGDKVGTLRFDVHKVVSYSIEKDDKINVLTIYLDGSHKLSTYISETEEEFHKKFDEKLAMSVVSSGSKGNVK